MNKAGTPAVTSPSAASRRACSQVSRSSGVRTTSTCGAPAAVLPPSCGSSSSGPAACGTVPGASTFTGVSSAASTGSAASAAQHRRLEPGLLQLRRQPGAGLVHPPGRDRHPQQHVHDVRGAFGRHVPVRGQHDRGGVQRRPVRHRPGVRAGRRVRDRDGPAARALQARQRPLRHRPGDLHVHDLRPPRHGRRRAVQADPAAAALGRRIRVLALARVRVPGQAPARVAGLPAPAAVLPALPLRFLTLRAAAFPRPDRLLRGRRARIGAVHPQPALQLRQPQLQPPLPLPGRLQLGPQYRFSASFASTTARSRDSSSRCSASTSARPGSSGTSHKHAQPELKVQPPASAGASRKALSLQPHLPGSPGWRRDMLTAASGPGGDLRPSQGIPLLSRNVPGTVRT